MSATDTYHKLTSHAMPCDCAQYEPIELCRKSITRRIRQSRSIRKRLIQIAERTALRICLFRCPECGEFWQSGHEWHSADREYLFRVPPIDLAEWQREPYQQPAAMMIYSSVMREFFARGDFETSHSPCHAKGCTQRALRLSVFCRDHHIQSLQERGLLPKKPIGRLFPPYHVEAQSTL